MLDTLSRGPTPVEDAPKEVPLGGAPKQVPSGDDSVMFELAPVSLWLEDFSEVRALFDAWRAEGVTDLRAHFRAHPERVAQCAHSIRVIKVNRKTLTMFEADSLATLTSNLGTVFRDDMLKTHLEELCQLWTGAPGFTSQTVNYTLGGRRLDVLLKGA